MSKMDNIIGETNNETSNKSKEREVTLLSGREVEYTARAIVSSS
jgi:hypothetical protein